MRSIILKIRIVFLLFAIVGTGCEKHEDISYLDNTVKFNVQNFGFAIYKTKKDYFFNVSVRPMENFIQTIEISEESTQITLYKGKYYYKERYSLVDDYVLSKWMGPDHYFTSLSFDTYVREKLSDEFNQGITNTKVINCIIDRDPFTEFYYSQHSLDDKTEFTIDEINQLIKEKNLDKYFKKLK